MADPFLGQLEPLAESHLRDGSLSYEHALLASVAVSLKRIADALLEPNEYGEVGGAALARAIKQGLEGSR